jgi:hypothetical protein
VGDACAEVAGGRAAARVLALGDVEVCATAAALATIKLSTSKPAASQADDLRCVLMLMARTSAACRGQHSFVRSVPPKFGAS